MGFRTTEEEIPMLLDAEHTHAQAMKRHQLRQAGLPVRGTIEEDMRKAWLQIEHEMDVDRVLVAMRRKALQRKADACG